MRIGEAAAAAGMTAKALRFYESCGLLPPAPRSPNGYREYPEDAVSRLRFIRRGQAAGLTLDQIKGILNLREAGESPCSHVRDLLARELQDLDRRITELISLRADVAGFHRKAVETDPASCDPDQVCSLL